MSGPLGGGDLMKSTVQASVRRMLRPWVLSTLAATAVAGQAAADQAATPSDTLEEIVVTAQFRQQNLQDTPLAITAVTAEMMEERGQKTLHDVGQQAPNVTLVETGGAFGP